MYLGKQVRLERIINRETGRTIIVPMDHGVTIGAVDGLIDMRETVNDMAVGGADAVLMHKGLVRCSHRNAGKDVGLIVHLSASTMLSPQGNTKTLVGTVEEGIVKVPYTGDMESFSDVVSACCVPVVIAGGERMDSTRDVLQMVHDAIKAGGAGISMGRNVFQHPNRIQLVRALRAIVHENATVEEALAIVGE